MNGDLYYSGVCKESIVDGLGVRYTIFFSGCKHRCPDCHNKATWDFENGRLFTKKEWEKVFSYIRENTVIKGITLSGGDPLYSANKIIEFVEEFKRQFPDKDIWLYTGFRLTSIEGEDEWKLINLCDYVVDGRFVKDLYDPRLKFRGSSNQKIYKKVNDSFVSVEL